MKWAKMTSDRHGADTNALKAERDRAQQACELMGRRIAELEERIRSIEHQCDSVIFNCERQPADNDRHIASWRSVRDYAAASIR